MTDIQDRATAPATAPLATTVSALDALELDLLELDLLELAPVELDLLEPAPVPPARLEPAVTEPASVERDPIVEEADLDPASSALPARGAARRAARIRRRTVVMWTVTVLLTLLVAATLLFQASGGRWFVVQTPSMGTTAPVGTLLLTTPVLVEDVEPGDIVSFHPSTAPDETYTHRVIAVDADGLTTQGDINGAVDPWKTDQEHLIGEATTILPGFGWLAKGLPLMLAGLVIVMILTRLIASPTHRASMRMLGGSLVAAFTVFLLKPFVGLVVLDAATAGSDVRATIVNTGLLPIRVAAEGGSATSVVSGAVSTITAPAAEAGHFHDISSTLDLPLWGWVVFFALCAVPLLWTLIVGLPTEEERRA
ncbi:S26 family signal peptidase [Clavibacter sp. CFBP 8614]|uniref:S26 family signal peptidase n=1 Tax=unclassified Clavibacter TaxID=2626594 RepID=UPI00404305B9